MWMDNKNEEKDGKDCKWGIEKDMNNLICFLLI